MKTEFRRAALPGELRALMAFDRKIFSRSDRFSADYWRQCESWWMLVDGVRAGCCAFEVDTQPAGILYIATTGILPKYQGRGLGLLLKSWEVAYGRQHGYSQILTHSRKSNVAMITLNKRSGFRALRTIRGYYESPAESCVEMQLVLK